MSSSNRIVKNIFSNWSGFAINLAIAFFLSPFLVKSLGAVYYGLWVILNQFTGYMSILDLGVRSAVTKHVANYHGSQDTSGLNRIVSTAVSIYSAVAVGSLGISAAMVYWVPSLFDMPPESVSSARMVIAIGGLTVAQAFVFNIYYGVLMGIQRYDLFNRLAIIIAVGKAVALVVLLTLDYGIVAMAAVQGASSVLNNLGARWLCRRELPALRVRLVGRRHGAYSEVFDYSVASFFVVVSQKIIYQADVFVIGVFVNTAAVTIYAIPGTLIEYMRRIIIAMTETFVPLASQLKAQADHTRIRALLLQGTRMAALVGLPICIVFLTMGERFIALWMGPEYASAGRNVLLVLSISQLFSVTHMTAREVLNGIGKHKWNARIFGVEAVANLILSVILVQRFGLLGVAIGTAVPHILMAVVVYPVIAARVLGFSLVSYVAAVARAWLAVLPFGVTCYALNRFLPAHSLAEFFLQVAAAGLVYLAGAWLIGLNPVERRQTVDLVRKRATVREAAATA
jgi:O-antigen/teichoic acid export membrane protein